MKLHKDGTLEGTPQEIAEYANITGRLCIPEGSKLGKSEGNPLIPNPLIPAITCAKTAASDIMKIQEDVQKNRQPWERPVAIL